MPRDFPEFDPDGPFHDLAMTFAIAVVGVVTMRSDNPMNFRPDHGVALAGKVISPDLLVNPLALLNDPKVQKIVAQGYASSLSRMLANIAFESVKDRNDGSPEFEFLRHVRNAGSHGNKFNFHPWEPSRPAAWRTMTIDHALKGSANPLQGKPCFGSYVATADVLALLWDIEKKLI